MAVAEQQLFVGVYLLKADSRDVVDSRSEAVGGDIIGRARLEFERQLVPRCLLPADGANHLTATLIRRQTVEPLLASVEHADARRPIHLVSAESQEVAADVAHVDRYMRCTLRSIHQHGDAMTVSQGRNVLDRIDRAQDVAHMGQTDETCALGDILVEQVDAQPPVVGNGQMPDHNASLHGLHLPRHDVRVVLHVGNQHLVARLHLRLAEGSRHKVDGLRRAASEDNLVGATGVDELTDALAGRLVQLGSFLRKVMHAAMHVGVDVQILVAHSIEHGERLLRGSSIV